jgi:hypothetical protein
MRIDVKKTKVYLISPATGKYTERLMTVFRRLITAGFSNIVFQRAIQDPSGTNSLTRTNLEIFRKEVNSNEPFIIMEDDCALWNDYDTIDIPDNADALYLGVSLWIYPHPYDTLNKGYHIRENTPADIQSVDDQLTKINGMTSTHAILFLNRLYIINFIQRMERLLANTTPHDLVFATMQPSSRVYALKKPMFYQDASIGGQEDVTRLVFNGQTYRRA